MRYAISNVKNVQIPFVVDTKQSAYPVIKYKGFKNFATRELAREYKRTRMYPQKYMIVDTARQMIVR